MKEKATNESNGRNKKLEKKKISIKKIIKVVFIIGISTLLITIFFPDKTSDLYQITGRYSIEILMLFPAILIIMGLVDIWIPDSLIEKYLGSESGVKGKFLAIIMGTFSAGPMFIALPIAGELLRKKASIDNILVFIGVWASLKIPQLGVEIQFMGLKFTFIRFLLTLLSVNIIAFIIKLMYKGEENYA